MLTRLGFHFVFVAGFAMVGGALRGFNLLLVLAGVLVGAILMQWRYSRRMIATVTVERRLPTEAIAGVPFRVRYRLRNRSRFMPTWMIWIEDRFGQGNLKRSLVARHDDIVAKCAVGYIGPMATVFAHIDCVFAQRGRYRFGPLASATIFPFSLMTTRSITNNSDSFFVFPSLLQLRSGWQRSLMSRNDGVLAGSRRSGLADGEFFGLREWRSGDNPRWIHWRTTARIGELTVRQFEQHRRFDLCILIDGYNSSPRDDGSFDLESDVETTISLAATLIVQLAAQPVNQVTLAVASNQAFLAESGPSSESQKLMLQQLAEVKPCGSPKLCAAVQECAKHFGPARDLIVISPRSFEDASAVHNDDGENPSLEQLLAPWRSRQTFRWLDVRQPDVTHWVCRPNAPKPLTEGAA